MWQLKFVENLIKFMISFVGGGGATLTFETGVLMMCLLGVGKVFSGLKFRGSKGAISKF